MLSSGKQPPELVTQVVRNSILDTYVLEFLDLPDKQILKDKLQELAELALIDDVSEE